MRQISLQVRLQGTMLGWYETVHTLPVLTKSKKKKKKKLCRWWNEVHTASLLLSVGHSSRNSTRLSVLWSPSVDFLLRQVNTCAVQTVQSDEVSSGAQRRLYKISDLSRAHGVQRLVGHVTTASLNVLSLTINKEWKVTSSKHWIALIKLMRW